MLPNLHDLWLTIEWRDHWLVFLKETLPIVRGVVKYYLWNIYTSTLTTELEPIWIWLVSCYSFANSLPRSLQWSKLIHWEISFGFIHAFFYSDLFQISWPGMPALCTAMLGEIIISSKITWRNLVPFLSFAVRNPGSSEYISRRTRDHEEWSEGRKVLLMSNSVDAVTWKYWPEKEIWV